MKIKGLLIIALVAVLAIIGGNNLNAQTAAGTALNNTAIITAANASGIGSDSTNTTTGQIAGATYTVVPADAGGATGALVPLQWTIRNDGNASDTFSIAIFAVQSNLIAVPWVYTLASGTTGALAPTATANITLNVTIDAAAPNGSYYEFRIQATSANIAASVLERSYRGDNGTYYGGQMGIAWDGVTTNNDGILRHGMAAQNSWVRVAASGPVLRLYKSIVSIQRGGAGVASAIPGSTITYNLVVSNIGSVAATSVIVRDTYPAATTYVSASAISGDTAGWTPTDNGTSVEFARVSFPNTNGTVNVGYATLQVVVTVD